MTNARGSEVVNCVLFYTEGCEVFNVHTDVLLVPYAHYAPHQLEAYQVISQAQPTGKLAPIGQ